MVTYLNTLPELVQCVQWLLNHPLFVTECRLLQLLALVTYLFCWQSSTHIPSIFSSILLRGSNLRLWVFNLTQVWFSRLSQKLCFQTH